MGMGERSLRLDHLDGRPRRDRSVERDVIIAVRGGRRLDSEEIGDLLSKQAAQNNELIAIGLTSADLPGAYCLAALAKGGSDLIDV